jgi:hypothetical protein
VGILDHRSRKKAGMRRQLILLIWASALAVATAPTWACGIELWSLKVLSDGVPVDFAQPTDTTIAQLIAMQPPGRVREHARQPFEQRVYVVHATLTELKLETDEDFHLVLEDAAGNTMIAEIPAPDCATNARFAQLWGGLRQKLVAHYGLPGRWEYPDAAVTVAGVGFFDVIHGQRGVAPNGIELHPVLALTFSGAPLQVPTLAGAQPGQETIDGRRTSTPLSFFDDEQAALAACGRGNVVWLNKRSGIYHSPGSRWYGISRHSAYVCKSAADGGGFRPAARR